MERVHAAADEPVQEMQGVAVAVSSNRRHLGLLYRTEVPAGPASAAAGAENAAKPEEVRLLHLGWYGHGQFHNDPDTSDCAFWISPDVEPEQADVIAGYLAGELAAKFDRLEASPRH